MPKINLNNLTNLQNEVAATTAINTNNTLITEAIENTISRDGAQPNMMNSVLDMNSNKIINLPDGVSDQEPVTYSQFIEGITSVANGAVIDAPFVTLGLSDNMLNDRVLTAGLNLSLADTGPKGVVEVRVEDPELNALAAVNSSANKLPYFTGAGTASVTDFTPYARTLVDDIDATAARATLGVVIDADVQPHDPTLNSLVSAGNGIMTKTGLNTITPRTVTGTTNEITVTNGSGVSGNPTVSLPSALTFTGKTVTGGTYSSPSLTTPSLGAATATSINKVAITQPATAATLTIANNKTLTANNTLTLAGTDSSTLTFQGTDTYVGRSTTDTLSNKTLTSPAITGTASNGASQFNLPGFSVRQSLGAIEFGHSNTAGYGSVLSQDVGSGAPYLGFNVQPGTANNTFKTVGMKASVLKSDMGGGFILGNTASANADNQDLTTTAFLSTSGVLDTTGGYKVSGTNLSAVTETLTNKTISGSSNTLSNISNASLATAADGTIKSNISGSTAVPSDNTITAVLDKQLGTTQGTIAYRGASTWNALTPGTSGNFLKTQGSAANPVWDAIPGGGDLLSTNNLSDLTNVTTARNNLKIQKKNYIVNGAMMVSQEYAGTATTALGSYPVDQWKYNGVHSGTVSVSQVSKVTPSGAPNRLRATVTAADTSMAASEFSSFVQPIEGYITADLRLGTSSAKWVTLRFGVSAPAGTYSIALYNGSFNRSYVSDITITSGEANTDVYRQITVPLDITGTWGVGNGIGLYVQVTLSTGSNYQYATTNAWIAGGVFSSTSQFNFLGTAGNVFELFDVGLYEGTAAPDFVVPDFNLELTKCQRYWQKSYRYIHPPGTVTNDGMRNLFVDGLTTTAHSGYLSITFATSMRTVPTSISFSPGTGASGKARDGSNGNDISSTIQFIGDAGFLLSGTGASTNLINMQWHWTADARM